MPISKTLEYKSEIERADALISGVASGVLCIFIAQFSNKLFKVMHLNYGFGIEFSILFIALLVFVYMLLGSYFFKIVRSYK